MLLQLPPPTLLGWTRRGRPIYTIAGGAPDDPPVTAAPGAVGVVTPPAPPVPTTGTFTQDDLTRLAAREKAQGERAGEKAGGRKLAEQLGLDPDTFDAAAVRKILEGQRTAELEKLSEADKAKADAQADRAAAAADRAAALAERLAGRKERVLRAAGVPDGKGLAVAVSALEITLDDDDATVTAAVAALQGDIPGLFAPGAPRVPGAPGGAPTGTPPRQTPNGDKYEAGAARARALIPAPVSA